MMQISQIMELSKTYSELKTDNKKVIERLNELTVDRLENIKQYLEEKSPKKINKIRLLVVSELLNKTPITVEKIEEIKTKVNDENETNILNSWKSYFSLFYIFFYSFDRERVRLFLLDFVDKVIVDLQLSEVAASRIVDFDGAQNFGSDRAWVAIYNKKQPSQSSSLQLFIQFAGQKITYGLYEYISGHYKTEESINIVDFNFEKMISFLEKSKQEIIDDIKLIKYWKFSPGEKAIYWNEMKNQGIASIGWGNYDFSGKSRNQIEELNPSYFDSHSKSPAIIRNFNKANVGDFIYAFRGRKEVVGFGVIKEVSKYSDTPLITNTDHHNYHIVDWVNLESAFSIKNMAPMDTFSDISDRRLELKGIGREIDERESEQEQEVKNTELSANQILFGPPGTGKTYSTVDLALKLINSELYRSDDREENLKNFSTFLDDEQIVFTTFHQSYGYEDFVEGIKVEKEKGELTYHVKPGIFKKLCIKAKEDLSKPYVLIIDEINRGNISKIFGELITLIETDKRDGAEEALSVTLPYSKKPFSVPRNVHIIGTMNTADASIAKLDVALRRRFDFIEMPSKPDLINDENGNGLIVEGIDIQKMLNAINDRIELLYDRDHTIGHSFFMKIKDKELDQRLNELGGIFQNNIIPLLQEYFFEDWERIHWVLDCLKGDENNTHFIKKKYKNSDSIKKLMGDKWVSTNNNYDSDVWKLNLEAFEVIASYKAIYEKEEKTTIPAGE